jgi:outer membrane protein assembly factor BamB
MNHPRPSLCALALLATIAVCQLDPLSPWPVRGATITHTGRSTALGGPITNYSLAWNFSTDSTIRSSPAVGADGTVFIGSDDGSAYAIFPNGTMRWNFTTSSPFYECSPALSASGTVFIANNDRYVYALAAATGSVLWRRLLGWVNRGAPTLSLDGLLVFIGSLDGNLYALRAATGNVQWQRWTGGQVHATPALSPDGSRLFVGSTDNSMRAYAALTGSVQWTFYTGGRITSSPALGSDGTVYFGSYDGYGACSVRLSCCCFCVCVSTLCRAATLPTHTHTSAPFGEFKLKSRLLKGAGQSVA